MIQVSIGGIEKVSEDIQCLEDNRREIKEILNEAVKKAQARMRDEIKSRYLVLKKEIDEASSKKNATLSNLIAELRVKGNAKELGDYKVSPFEMYSLKSESGMKRPSIVKAQVLRGGDLKDLEKDGVKAFVTEFKSGHKAVVQRVKGEVYSNSKERAERQEKHWDLTKIKSLYSVSLPQLATQRDIRSAVETTIWKEIREIAEHTLLGKLKG